VKWCIFGTSEGREGFVVFCHENEMCKIIIYIISRFVEILIVTTSC
jgi:hypothetical protein